LQPKAEEGREAMQQEIVLEPGRSEHHYWRELWSYRELFQVLVWRDLSIRYKQTVIGVVWALIRPALAVLIFTAIFNRIAKLPSEGAAPYPVLVLTGMLPWTLFSMSLAEASNSLLNNAQLITKVYFPRIIIPTATLGVALVDFLITFGLLIVVMAFVRFVPGWQILALPFFIALALLASLGPALWLTAINVKYRDFRYVIPFIVQFGLYISPVGFSSTIVPESWRGAYSLNPMVGVIDGFRWCLLGTTLDPASLGISILIASLFLLLGVRQFRKMERGFADLV
jgi:lipopolysaccharide transport system permease protein